MFEEDNFGKYIDPRRKAACFKQCRRSPSNFKAKLGSCPCDVTAECMFYDGEDDVWFRDKLKYLQQLASE